MCFGYTVVYNCVFLQKLIRQRNDVMSFGMQFEKGDVGYCGRLSGVRGSVSLAKSEGEKKKVSVLKNGGEHGSIFSDKNKHTRSNCLPTFPRILSFFTLLFWPTKHSPSLPRPLFQTACEMTSTLTSFRKKTIVYYLH